MRCFYIWTGHVCVASTLPLARNQQPSTIYYLPFTIYLLLLQIRCTGPA